LALARLLRSFLGVCEDLAKHVLEDTTVLEIGGLKEGRKEARQTDRKKVEKNIYSVNNIQHCTSF
jgi:hypothetical protein